MDRAQACFSFLQKSFTFLIICLESSLYCDIGCENYNMSFNMYMPHLYVTNAGKYKIKKIKDNAWFTIT